MNGATVLEMTVEGVVEKFRERLLAPSSPNTLRKLRAAWEGWCAWEALPPKSTSMEVVNGKRVEDGRLIGMDDVLDGSTVLRLTIRSQPWP